MKNGSRIARFAATVVALAGTALVWAPLPAGADPVCTVTDQVTSTAGGQNVVVSYSGDGSRIAFVSNRNLAGTNADLNNEIFVYDAATASYTQVTSTSGSGGGAVPSISSAGTRVAFQSNRNIGGGNADGNNEIFLYDSAGPTTTQITSTPGTATNASPKISADGTRIGFSSDANIGGGNADLNQEIYLYDSTGPTTTQVTTTPTGRLNGSPTVTSNGTRVAFRSNADITGGNADLNREIFLYDSTGPTTTQITTTPNGSNDGPSISGNGARIAFRSTSDIGGGNADLNQEVYLYDSTGPTTTQVTSTTGSTTSSDGPSISAAGTRIAFKSNGNIGGGNADLTNEIFAFDSVAAATTQVTSTPIGGGGNRAPAISGDGTGITWESDRNIGGGNADANFEIYRTACGLSVTKTADQTTAAVGGTIGYHVTLQNTGNLTLTGLFVSDPNAPGCNAVLPDLAAGQSRTVDCTYSPTLSDIGTYANVATADSDQTPPVASNQVDVAVDFAPGAGALAGTVTEAGSGAPIPGAWVAVLRTSDFSLARGAVAGGDGTFAVQLAGGSYYLYLIDPAGAHTAGLFGAPSLVTVTAGNTTSANPTMPSNRGSITGAVTAQSNAAPIPGALALTLNGSTTLPEIGVTADGAGQFSLAGLRAGTHFTGFIDPTGAHRTEFYPSSPTIQGSTPVAVAAGGSTAANGSLPTQPLTPGGAALSGTVAEAGTADPLAGVFVMALRAADYQMVRTAVTDATGAYDLDVQAGSYKLIFFDSTGLHDMEWHDDLPFTGIEGAASVTAPAVTDAALDRNTGAMAGTITDDPAGTPVAGAWVVAIGPTGIAAGALAAADGTYDIGGLPVGTYRATFLDPTGSRAQEYWDNSPTYPGATTFNITGGATTAVNAALASP